MQSTGMESRLVSSLLELLLCLAFPVGWNAPPAPHDPNLIRTAPPNALAYCEWSGQGQGVPGAPGIDGLAADPEFRELAQLLIDDLANSWEANAGSEADLAWRENAWDLLESLVQLPGAVSLGVRNGDPVFAPFPAPLIEQLLDPLHMVVAIRVGDRWPELAPRFQAFLSKLPGATPSDNPRHETLFSAFGKLPIVWHREGDYLLLTLGTDVSHVASGRLAGAAPCLAEEPRFAAALAACPQARRAGLVWFDVRESLVAIPRWLGTRGALVTIAANFLGLKQFDSYMAHAGVDAGEIVTRARFATNGGIDGVLAGSAGRPLSKSILRNIPPDSELVGAFSFSLEKLFAAAEQTGAKFTPLASVVGGLSTSWEQTLGLNIQHDFIPAFGDHWTMYSSPSYTGASGTGIVLGVDVRDPQRANAAIQKAMTHWHDRFLAEDPPRASMKSLEFGGRTMFYVQRESGGTTWPWTFCVTERQFLIALHPQAMKGHLRFLEDAAAGRVAGRVSAGSLRADMVLSQPAETMAYLWCDTPSQMNSLLGSAPLWSGRPGGSLAALWPSPRMVSAYIRPTELAARRSGTGLEFESRMSIPPLWLAVAARALIRQPSASMDSEIVPAAAATLGAPSSPGVSLGAPTDASGAVKTPAASPGSNAAPNPNSPPADAPSANVPAAPKRSPAIDFLRSVAPPEVQALIPEDSLRRLEENAARRREERARERERRRIQRMPP